MYNLFNEFSPNRGLIEFGKFRVLREQLRQNLDKAISYYRTNRTWVDSKHPLVSLINSINVPLSLETQVYNDKVQDMALELGQMFRYTSPVSKGTMREPSMFYGSGVVEAVLVSIEYYDVNQLALDWRNAEPIRILRHPKSDLGLSPLNSSTWSPEEGVAVISLNLPMLATQYKLWMKEEGVLEDGEVASIPTFLSRYPMANALRSHFDLAFFNRMSLIYQGKPPAEPVNRTPFWTLDLSSRVDEILVRELISLNDRRITFDDMLSQIPCITASCLGELFRVPEKGIYTRQVVWAYTLFRLPLLSFLLQQNSRSANPRNTYYLKEIRRYFIATGNDREVVQMLPMQYQQRVLDEIRYGILPYLHPTAFGVESDDALPETA